MQEFKVSSLLHDIDKALFTKFMTLLKGLETNTMTLANASYQACESDRQICLTAGFTRADVTSRYISKSNNMVWITLPKLPYPVLIPGCNVLRIMKTMDLHYYKISKSIAAGIDIIV